MYVSRSAFRALPSRIVLAAIVLGIGSVHAATYTVGTTGGCSHANLQTAVNTAQANPGADTIRVNSETFNAQEVSINTNQELNIIGGYANCSATEPTAGARSILDGSGGNARPVMRIVVPTGGLVRLRNLRIRDGDNGTAGEGGGIYFEGNGRLGIVDSTLSNNIAGYGAGLYARGTDADAEVTFGANVTVLGNTARYSGGGVYVDQVKFTMLEAGSGIFLNEAQGGTDSGFGGGMVILAKSRDATAFIGPGMGSLGVIYNNKARYGGGVAIEGNDNQSGDSTRSMLVVHSPIAGQPAGIRNNVASALGGGIHLNAHRQSVGGDDVDTEARLWNTELKGNSAPEGAAIYNNPDGNISGVNINSDDLNMPPPGPFACPANQFCGGIIDNVAQTIDGTPTTGAVVRMMDGIGGLGINRADHDTNNRRPAQGGVVIEGNRGGRLFHIGKQQPAQISNVLIADNQTGNALIEMGDDWYGLSLFDSTVAGNVIPAGSPVLRIDDVEVRLVRTIVWQSGRTVLQCNGCDKIFERVIANERGSLDGGNGTQVVVADPRFIDLANGDYRLRAASPAVDYVPGSAADDRDAIGLPRDLDLPIKVNTFGVRDIGAVERQTLQPLVLNSDFDPDLRLWTPVTGVISRDTTMNASGGAGSGSLYVTRSGAGPGLATIAARQCIHLPGPARYSLNGWGRTLPNALYVPPLDSTQLRWTLRHAGGESCTSGAVAASGTLALSSGSWSQAASPAVIDVTTSAWTAQSSLTVELVVIENSTTAPATSYGWFDGITLGAESLDDVIFADGFD